MDSSIVLEKLEISSQLLDGLASQPENEICIYSFHNTAGKPVPSALR